MLDRTRLKRLAFRLLYLFFLVLSFILIYLFFLFTLGILLCVCIHVRVRDTGMIDGLEAFCQYELGECNVAEGDRALLEETFCHLPINEFVYQVADALFCVFIE